MRNIVWLMALWMACLQAFANDNIRMVFVGDMMLAETVGQYIRRGGNPMQHVAHLFKGADITIGNLETAVGTHGEKAQKPFTFLAHPRVIPFLKRNFSAVSLANNHSVDYGIPAFEAMLDAFDRQGLRYFGGGQNIRSAHEPVVFHVKGKRIAVLGYDIFQPRSFEADTDRPGVAWSEDSQVLRDIRAARTIHKADVVIPVMHWGWEDPIANDRQRQLARLMIDAGADAVIGGHPHQLQDTERYQGKPIFYSLGNFVFDGFPLPINYIGWALRMELDKNGVQKIEAHVSHIGPTGLPKPGKVLADPSLK